MTESSEEEEEEEVCVICGEPGDEQIDGEWYCYADYEGYYAEEREP